MKIHVTFQPSGVTVRVDEGANLLDAALAAGVHINASCGGQGVCGKCRVVLESGDAVSEESEHITSEEYEKGCRLACRTRVTSDCSVEIPPESRGPEGLLPEEIDMGRAERRASPFDAAAIATDRDLNPLGIRLPLALTPPTLEENKSDLTRLLQGLKRFHHVTGIAADLSCIHDLPDVVRKEDWKVTATLMEDPGQSLGLSGTDKDFPPRLVGVEPGDTSGENVAIALDIGTTTISVELVDLHTGRLIAERTAYNKQMNYGADVITRIVYAKTAEGLERLQSAVAASVNELLGEVFAEGGCRRSSVSSMCAAGNTTMTHLFLGMEPRYIREAPYVPLANYMPLGKAGEIGLDLPPCLPVYTFPCVASYVGGDIVSGILGSGVSQTEALTLYMDIGTNGEIVLGNKELLACAACSMGPAFEGGGIKHGMRADIGAIEGFHINPITLEPMVVTMGRSKARGICGSGLISILAELLAAGVIDQNGKFEKDLPSDRVRYGEFGNEYVLVWGKDSATGTDIAINEVDFENLIRAKGALYAGCLTLLESLALSFDDLERIIIAGAFGRYINLTKGKLIGLFPDVAVEKFHFLGNGSVLGARLTCLYKDVLGEIERIADMMTNVELSDNQSFMDKYMGALFLPHTESGLFPEVTPYIEESRAVAHRERTAK